MQVNELHLQKSTKGVQRVRTQVFVDVTSNSPCTKSNEYMKDQVFILQGNK